MIGFFDRPVATALGDANNLHWNYMIARAVHSVVKGKEMTP